MLPGRVRRGYGLGSVATGAFGTVPGLLLLPYLTDRLGVAAGLAGLIVLLPKAWDVLLNPVAGRISDRSTHPDGRRRPFLVRADLPFDPGCRVGRRALPRVRQCLRLLPGPLRLHACRADP